MPAATGATAVGKALRAHGDWDWQCALSGTLPVIAWMDLGLGGILLFSALLLFALALIAYAIAGFWERWSRRRKERAKAERRAQA